MSDREPGEGGLRSLAGAGSDNGRAPSRGTGEVEAYEQDWYRSLKALAERARELQEEAEPEGTGDQGSAPAGPGPGSAAEVERADDRPPEPAVAETEAAGPRVVGTAEVEAAGAEGVEAARAAELGEPAIDVSTVPGVGPATRSLEPPPVGP
ncbi:MAG TPA: hypothetical protein VNO79_09465, partial [Actinomycetota bacterium]|nr:hypothetical protein [Actinomycetota bacterium]